MTYVLAPISPTDREKIIQDAATDIEKQKRLLYAIKWKIFAETWAVDRERNCYLLQTPAQTREESDEDSYFAFVDGNMYKINRLGFFGDWVYFDEQSAEAVPSSVAEEVTAAFAVYGCWGEGPLNEFGIPEFALIPKFTKKRV
jgi:hypothetical protein